MKKISVAFILLCALLCGCSSDSGEIVLRGDIQNGSVSAVSTVAGRIVEMPKAQGERVVKGDVIAVIDSTAQKYAVDQQQAVVDMKRAKLDELKSGARPEQIDAAEAAVEMAEAKLAQLRSGNRREVIRQADAAVKSAKAKLDEITGGSRAQQIEQSEAAVESLQASVRSGELNLTHTRDKYEQAKQLFELGEASQSNLLDAESVMNSASQSLESAKSQLKGAQAALDLLREGASPEAIRAAQGAYEQAVAQADLAKAGATSEEIRAAEAAVAQAQAQLALLAGGSTEQSIAAMEADLAQSVATLNQAKYNLESCEIKALEDGIIISRSYNPGDVVNIGSSISDIGIDSDVYVLCYLPEQYLDRIAYNDEIEVKTTLGSQTGHISYIDLKTEYTPKDKQSSNDTKSKTVKIKVAIDSNGGKLKSGMTAEVIIPALGR